MPVASEKQNPSPAGLLREPLLLRHPAALCPAAEHFLALIPTQWGACAAVWKFHETPEDTPRNFAEKPCHALLCRLVLPGLPPGQLRRQLLAQYPICNEVLGDGRGGFHPEVVPDWFPELLRSMQSYYANTLRDSHEPQFVDRWDFWQSRLDWSTVTPFSRKVLAAAAKIPHGSRKTYGQIAKDIGKPHAGRAVGAALAANPWPVLVPCHRVIGANGRLTGFSAPGGIKTKARMLAMEQNP